MQSIKIIALLLGVCSGMLVPEHVNVEELHAIPPRDSTQLGESNVLQSKEVQWHEKLGPVPFGFGGGVVGVVFSYCIGEEDVLSTIQTIVLSMVAGLVFYVTLLFGVFLYFAYVGAWIATMMAAYHGKDPFYLSAAASVLSMITAGVDGLLIKQRRNSNIAGSKMDNMITATVFLSDVFTLILCSRADEGKKYLPGPVTFFRFVCMSIMLWHFSVAFDMEPEWSKIKW